MNYLDKRVIDNIADICSWIRTYFLENGRNCKAVIGISGGKSSTVCAALLVKALGRDRVIGVKMPNGDLSNVEAANKVADYLGIKTKEYDIHSICETYKKLFPEYDDNVEFYRNIPARIRMSILYAVAAETNGKVCCTSNRSKEYIKDSVRFGDAAGDFALLKDFTIKEIIEIGEKLDLPKKFIHRASYDEASGEYDEVRLGFTYDELDKYILDNKEPDFENLERIVNLHERKEETILCFKKRDYENFYSVSMGCGLSLKM